MAHEYPAELSLYIDGERLGTVGRTAHRVINPATGATLSELPLATAADLDRALDTAARGYRLWRARPAGDRSRVLAGAAQLLRQRIDRIAAIATMEEGKPLIEAKAEVTMAAICGSRTGSATDYSQRGPAEKTCWHLHCGTEERWADQSGV